MTTTPPVDLGDLLTKLATAEKTRAEAEKTRAEADKARSEAEHESKLAQNKLDVAAADLETKRLTNDKARADAEAARVDKLIERATSAVPDLSGVAKSTVTFADGRSLRQSEAMSVAVRKIAADIAQAAAQAVAAARAETRSDEATRVFVTDDTRLVATIASYWQIHDEATRLKAALGRADDDAVAAVGEPFVVEVEPQDDGVPGRRLGPPGDLVAVAAAVAGKAATEIASLFEVDVSVTSDTADIPALSMQTAVLSALLTSTGIDVVHRWARVPDARSPLRLLVGELVDADITVAQTTALLQAAIADLGDPAADLAQALKDAAADGASPDDVAAARQRAAVARAAAARLKTLNEHRVRLDAVVAKVKAFADRLTTASPTTGDSPLASAYSVEPLASDGAEGHWVLLLGPGTAETYQMVVTRRLLAPRLHITTGVEVDYLLVHGPSVKAAGHATASTAYWATIKRDGAEWKKTQPLLT